MWKIVISIIVIRQSYKRFLRHWNDKLTDVCWLHIADGANMYILYVLMRSLSLFVCTIRIEKEITFSLHVLEAFPGHSSFTGKYLQKATYIVGQYCMFYIIKMQEVLIENIFMVFGGPFFQQIFGHPICTNAVFLSFRTYFIFMRTRVHPYLACYRKNNLHMTAVKRKPPLSENFDIFIFLCFMIL